MQVMLRAAGFMVLAGIAGCAVPPVSAPATGNIPLVATPGPAKTVDQFRADDAECRVQAARNANRFANPAPSAEPGFNPTGSFPSGVVYLRCMASAHNIVVPYVGVKQEVFGLYEPNPVYVGIGYGYPWFYSRGYTRLDFMPVKSGRGGPVAGEAKTCC